MKQNILLKCLLAGVLGSAGALADIAVDKSDGVLSIVAEGGETMRVKIVAPDDTVIVDTEVTGSFSWTPSGSDGAYRYDVRVVPSTQKIASTTDIQAMAGETSGTKSDYAGGSVEVKNGQMMTNSEEEE